MDSFVSFFAPLKFSLVFLIFLKALLALCMHTGSERIYICSACIIVVGDVFSIMYNVTYVTNVGCGKKIASTTMRRAVMLKKNYTRKRLQQCIHYFMAALGAGIYKS